MQRGPGFHAEKVINCLIGGGVAAIIFARDSEPPCRRFSGNLLDIVNDEGKPLVSPLPNGAWPIVLGLSLQQGKTLKAALNASKVTSVTLASPKRRQTTVPIAFSTRGYPEGNSYYGSLMATGALGALWSAHTTCLASQILNAVEKTAKAKVDPSLTQQQIKALYGKALPQVWDAHNYLLANPCKPTPIVTITTTLKTISSAKSSQNDSAAGQHFGNPWASFKVTVVVREATTRFAIPNVPVTLALDPSNLASCGRGVATRHSSGWRMAVVFSCSRTRGASGALTITATAEATAVYESAKGFITVQV